MPLHSVFLTLQFEICILSGYYLTRNPLIYSKAEQYCIDYCDIYLVSIHNDTQFNHIKTIITDSQNIVPQTAFNSTPYNSNTGSNIFWWVMWIDQHRPIQYSKYLGLI